MAIKLSGRRIQTHALLPKGHEALAVGSQQFVERVTGVYEARK